MTWRWLICFSLFAALALHAASVTGSVRLVDSRDPSARRHDFSGVVVWLESVGNRPAAPAASCPAPPAQMEQLGKRFIPHVLAVPVGSAVRFPNFDPVFHNVFSNFSGQIFDLGLYPPHGSRTVTFRRPGVVRVFCNIHPTMSAVILVTREPWVAVSDREGSFRIACVPEGAYRLHVYHERARDKTLAELERRVTVPASGLALPPLEISETGYVETPHRNKYGQDYPPVVDDPRPYEDRP